LCFLENNALNPSVTIPRIIEGSGTDWIDLVATCKLSIEKSLLPPRGDISRRDAGVDLTTPKNLKAFGLRLLIVEANTHKPSLLFFFIHQQSLLNKSSREKISGTMALLQGFT
jgi:hypothetical protein